MRCSPFVVTLALSILAKAQLQPQTDTWNSTFSLSSSQAASANISNVTTALIDLAARFERTNWATGSVLSDSFYTDVPANSSTLPPGSLLKAQPFVNVSTYTLAPTLALSRILFVSESLNGTSVPASAYVLWPRLPLSHGPEGRIPLVTWGRGSSGFLPECAPSHIRNLWYQFSAPYTLALSGYAVVAPDYAGLGVAKDAQGREVVNEAVSNPSVANDLINAAKAAQAAFPRLSKDFVVVGHSEGGGGAWGVAQKMATNPVEGYLGTVAGSPLTNLSQQIQALGPASYVGFLVTAKGVASAYSNRTTISDILTEQGLRLLDLLEQVQGCNSVLVNLLGGLVAEGDPTKLAVLKQSFLETSVYADFINSTTNGGRAIKGPMLVLQGSADATAPAVVTSTAVNKTCSAFPGADLEYVLIEGVDHVPTMYASQRIWLQWIADRFAGKTVAKGCQRTTYGESSSARPLGDYSGDINYFLEYANQPYQVA